MSGQRGTYSEADYRELVEMAEQEVTTDKDHALRQLEHLRREIDYDYPAATLRPTRQAAMLAVTGYFKALENRARRQRALRRRFPDAT